MIAIEQRRGLLWTATPVYSARPFALVLWRNRGHAKFGLSIVLSLFSLSLSSRSLSVSLCVSHEHARTRETHTRTRHIHTHTHTHARDTHTRQTHPHEACAGADHFAHHVGQVLALDWGKGHWGRLDLWWCVRARVVHRKTAESSRAKEPIAILLVGRPSLPKYCGVHQTLLVRIGVLCGVR